MEQAAEGEGAVLVDFATVLVQEGLLEVDGGVQLDDVAAFLQPGVQRGAAAQTPARCEREGRRAWRCNSAEP